MQEQRMEQPEKVLWEEYLKICQQQGKNPSAQDFAKWAQSMLGNM
jgi:hypothetical protein